MFELKQVTDFTDFDTHRMSLADLYAEQKEFLQAVNINTINMLAER